jgi:RHS repeat-associated protein
MTEITVSGTTETLNRTYIYDDRHRLLEVTDNLDAAGTITYGYDANGNQSSRSQGGETTLFRYDTLNQVMEVVREQDQASLGTFSYDFNGLRVIKHGADGLLRYVYDDTSVLVQTSAIGDVVAKYDYGSDRLLSVNHYTQGRSYYHFDALGSPVNLTDTSVAIQARYQYDAWGNYRRSAGERWNPFGFTGHEYDEETDLYYAKARFYDPNVGRFISEDPFQGDIATPPSLHRYIYTYGNPTMFIDPYGTDVIEAKNGTFVISALEGLGQTWIFSPGRALENPYGLQLALRQATSTREEADELFRHIRAMSAARVGLMGLSLDIINSNRSVAMPDNANSMIDTVADLTGYNDFVECSENLSQAIEAYDEHVYNNPSSDDIQGLMNRKGETIETLQIISENLQEAGINAAEGSFKAYDTVQVTGAIRRGVATSLSKGATEMLMEGAETKIAQETRNNAIEETSEQVVRQGIRQGDEVLTYVSPLEIRFSQATASQNFSSKGTIDDLLQGLRNGTVSVDDVPAIRVVERNGQLITLDNRRLAAFKAAGVEKIPIQRVSLSDPDIAKEFARKYNPIDGGDIIVVVPNAAGHAPAQELLRQHGKIR